MIIRAHTQVQTNYQQEVGLFSYKEENYAIAHHLKLIKLIRKIVKMLHIVNYERSAYLTLSAVASHLLLLLSIGTYFIIIFLASLHY